MTTFFGFEVSDSMFKGTVSIVREELSATAAVAMIKEEQKLVVTASNKALIDAMKRKFGLEVTIPEKPPSVSLRPGDSMYVMQVCGLPLIFRHEYLPYEIEKMTFTFSYWTVD